MNFARASVSFIFSHGIGVGSSLGFERVRSANRRLVRGSRSLRVGHDASAQALDVLAVLLSSLLLRLIFVLLLVRSLLLGRETIPLLRWQLANALRLLAHCRLVHVAVRIDTWRNGSRRSVHCLLALLSGHLALLSLLLLLFR